MSEVEGTVLNEASDNSEAVQDSPVDQEVLQQEPQKETPAENADGEKADADSKEGAPETYKDFIMPEGIEVNPQAMEQFRELAKDLDISEEDAQKLVDIQTSLALEAEKQADQAFNDTLEAWLNESKADKEIGGDNFESNVALAKQALNAFGNEGLIDVLDSSGAGNHPEVLRFLTRIGKLVSEDRIHGSAGAKTEKDAASLLFPTMAS